MILLYIFHLVTFLIKGFFCIEMVDISGPVWANQGEKITLVCRYDLGRDAIYSMKWYKGDQEIYRYIPTDQPEYKYFNAPGIIVDEESSRPNQLVLQMTGPLGTGTYRCEITTETPSFVTLDRRKNLTVVVPPKASPRIIGVEEYYRVGDLVEINCTSQESKPAAIITWTVNGDEAKSDILLPNEVKLNETTGLESSYGSLRFTAEPHHFPEGRLFLSCHAKIENLWEASVEEVIFGAANATKTHLLIKNSGYYVHGYLHVFEIVIPLLSKILLH